LTTTEGVEFLSIVHIYYMKDYLATNFYTQTQLQTSGQSQVHWDNITNAPDISGMHWLDPAIARIIQFSATPPVSPSSGDFYIDTDDNHLYKYNGASWDDQGVPTTGDRVVNLDSTAESVYEWSGSAWLEDTIPSTGDAITIIDDGDGNAAIYTYTSSLTWVKIADIDPVSSTLQQAYNNGQTITVSNSLGPVVLDASSSTTAPLQLTEILSAPISNLDDGQIANIDGELYMYDSTATSFVSVNREKAIFGRRGNTRNQFLDIYVSGLTSNNTGELLPQNAIITRIYGMLSAAGICDIYIYKNDNFTTPIATLSFNASDKEVLTDVYVALTAQDHLQAYCSNSVAINDPVIHVEYAYTK